jgi:hypothetical protein
MIFALHIKKTKRFKYYPVLKSGQFHVQLDDSNKRSMSIFIGVGLLLYHSCTGRPDPQNSGIANSSHAFFI